MTHFARSAYRFMHHMQIEHNTSVNGSVKLDILPTNASDATSRLVVININIGDSVPVSGNQFRFQFGFRESVPVSGNQFRFQFRFQGISSCFSSGFMESVPVSGNQFRFQGISSGFTQFPLISSDFDSWFDKYKSVRV